MQVAAMNSRKIVLFPWNHPKSVMHTCEVFCGLETCNLHSIWIPSTPSHRLICSRRRSSFLRIMTYVRTSLSSMMVPNLNSVVFYYKTTTWSCLSGIACSHVCSRTSSCFGAYYHSSFPENLATSSHRFVLQTFIFPSRLDESGISCYQPDLNLRQIWWLELFQDLWCRSRQGWCWPTHLAGRSIIVASWLRNLTIFSMRILYDLY